MNWYRKFHPTFWVSIVLIVAAGAFFRVGKPVHRDWPNGIGTLLMWMGMWFWGYWLGRTDR